jgi:hypothetical protein
MAAGMPILPLQRDDPEYQQMAKALLAGVPALKRSRPASGVTTPTQSVGSVSDLASRTPDRVGVTAAQPSSNAVHDSPSSAVPALQPFYLKNNPSTNEMQPLHQSDQSDAAMPLLVRRGTSDLVAKHNGKNAVAQAAFASAQQEPSHARPPKMPSGRPPTAAQPSRDLFEVPAVSLQQPTPRTSQASPKQSTTSGKSIRAGSDTDILIGTAKPASHVLAPQSLFTGPSADQLRRETPPPNPPRTPSPGSVKGSSNSNPGSDREHEDLDVNQLFESDDADDDGGIPKVCYSHCRLDVLRHMFHVRSILIW